MDLRTFPEMKITRDKEVAEFPRVRTIKGIRFSNLDFLGLWSRVSLEIFETTQKMHKHFNESVTFRAIVGLHMNLGRIIRVIIRVTRIWSTVGPIGAMWVSVVINWIMFWFTRGFWVEGVVRVRVDIIQRSG